MRRHEGNPILTRAEIPEVSPFVRDPSSVFNPGAIRMGERDDLLLLRVQTRGRETVLMFAHSKDGVRFTVRPELAVIEGAEFLDPPALHLYDPRLTRLDGEVYAVLSADSEQGCHILTARMGEGSALRMIGITRDRESRNGVLFPERIGGRYCRLERPNLKTLPSGVRTGDAIWLAVSDDLEHWRLEAPVLSGRPRFWDEYIGSGPPPVKTRDGWLHLYHGVATHLGGAIYQAGVCLFDLHDPSRLLSRGRNNILEPREPYETVGQVPNVVFPSGMIVDGYDAEGFAEPAARVRVYYGAADTCIGVAESTIERLLEESRLQ